MPPDTDYRPNKRSYNSRTGKHVQITTRRFAEMWPTPTAQNAKHGVLSPSEADRVATGKAGLHAMVHVWPTPQAADHRNRGTKAATARRREIGKQVNLEAAVRFMWPTPQSRDWKSENVSEEFREERNAQSRGKTLSWEVTNFPTPTQQCAKGGSNTATREGSPDLQTVVGAALNPDWVEWLMGYNIGHTSLKVSPGQSSVKKAARIASKRSATRSSRRSPMRSGKP